ncbi:neuroendocrine convertase 1-like isoform X2 [Copidosoma floridanum]|uniref:neuroendocrine convertase 1-like isoform X2 n=1 Tax=Copidosoma floridanum TaxID=29053 RepID=UPI0006C99D36|nr:neuroendocrine convertase 1-like isoform X2 [Copidosoma floridanum]
MNRWSQSHRRLALCYCYIFMLNAKDCNTSRQEEGQQRYRDNHRQDRENTPEEWVVRLEGGPEVASLLALRSGYSHLGPVLGFKDTYLWRPIDGARYRKRGMPYAMSALRNRAKIVWADHQRAVRREKRDHYSNYRNSARGRASGETRAFVGLPPRNKLAFNDELWEQEWYLVDRERSPERDMTAGRKGQSLERLDLNVLPVYGLGITGRGVRIAVLDDGLEHTHEDLRANYDPEISYDITDRDVDPIPRYLEEDGNGHGTRCAGEIAMEADNGKCGVGVAFEAKIGGIKMLDGLINDRVEAEALGYRSDLVDIYTASWGPPDDGSSLEEPGRLASEALERGVTEGRAGRGSVYVWASGNGGSKDDDCGCDGYVGSVYTIAIGSASQAGSFPWYGEICPATLATTYSSGANQDQMIVTTDLKNTCTTSHTGTSASAPLAAGILALALQVNNNLTWRDLQHLVVYTSKHRPLRANPGWFTNAVGLWFNPRFGFGLMDAYALVAASSNWTGAPEKFICETPSSSTVACNVSYGVPQSLKFETDACVGGPNEIQYLEHVQVETNIEYSLRGALQIHLTAPSGTKVQILGKRKFDNSSEGFANWKFMSVATWGENPRGTWVLDIIDEVGPENNSGSIGTLNLILHGTKDRPDYLDKVIKYDDGSFEEVAKLNDIADGNGNDNVLDESEHYENRSNNFNATFDEDWLIRFLLSV